MIGTSPYIQCGQCGHRHPVARARGRGYIECSCGLPIAGPRAEKRRHRLAGAVAIVVIVAALGGGAYLWARGLG